MYLVTYQIILGNLNKFNEQLNVAGQKVLKIDENVFFFYQNLIFCWLTAT